MGKSLPQDQFHLENSIKFCKAVEALVESNNRQADEAKLRGQTRPRMGFMEAVLTMAERHGIEETMAASYLSPVIKERIRQEAEYLHLMPRSASL